MVIQMYVYFIQGQVTRLVKIGSTTSDVKHRFSTLQSSSPDKLKLLKVIKGDYKLEYHLHQQFESVRSHGEWFYPSRGLMAFIESLEGINTRKKTTQVSDAQKRKQQRIKSTKEMWNKGMSKAKIANELGVSIATIQKYLPKGKNPNQNEYLMKRVYELRQSGFSWREIELEMKPDITMSTAKKYFKQYQEKLKDS